MNHTLSLAPGPVLVFGGPYSNLAATVAMRDVADALGLPPQNCICTGDVAAYCAHPEATAELIQAWGVPVVMGNCEESLGSDADDCGCGFGDDSTCSVLSVGWYSYAQRQISDATRRWMRDLPRSVEFCLGPHRFVVVHGSVSRINQFVFPSSPESVKRAELALVDADVVIGGHSGIPFGQRIGTKTWLNAGAIGMPANDGTEDGWYMTLTPGAEGVTARWHRLEYAAGGESKAMRAQGLSAAYADALLDGRWPSLDVLPDAERRQSGRALALPALLL